MEEKKYLNEDRYQKTKKKIVIGSIVILVLSLIIGGSLITVGVIKQTGGSTEKKLAELKTSINTEEENLESLKDELEEDIATSLATEKEKLEEAKEELESNGVTYKSTTTYGDGDAYNLMVITRALDPGFNYCMFDEYANNSLTKTYCSLVNGSSSDAEDLQLIEDVLNSSSVCSLTKYQSNSLTGDYCKLVSEYEDLDMSSSNKFGTIVFYMFGGFIIVAGLMLSSFVYMIAKRREIMAFGVQQTMPVAKETIDEMAPSAGNVAKEIAKGIKEGLDEEKK